MKLKTPRAPLSVAQVAQVFQMLADASRLRILLLLTEREELSVSELSAAIKQSQPSTSRHLSLLRAAGLVSPRRAGQCTFYSISSDLVHCVLEAVEHAQFPPRRGHRAAPGSG